MNRKIKTIIKIFLLSAICIATFLLAIYIVSDNYYTEAAGAGGVTFTTAYPGDNPEDTWDGKVYVEMDSPSFTMSYPHASYTGLFPIDGDELNKSVKYYCMQHGTQWGGYTGPDDTIGDHETYQVTSELLGLSKSDDPEGDIDTGAEIYVDSGGAIKDSVYKSYDHDDYVQKGGTPENKAVTNWVYKKQNITFSCESNGGNSISDGGLAFILATLQSKSSRPDYQDDPCQHAVWGWLGQGGPGIYADVATQYDKYHEDVEPYINLEKGIYVTPDSNVGTTYSSGTYSVGPFTMSDYIRAQDYDTSQGNLQSLMGDDHKGTIIKAEAKFKNEDGGTKWVTIKDSEIPAPNSSGNYFTFSEDDIAGYDELLDIRFTYQVVHASGGGEKWIGYQYELSFNVKNRRNSHCTVRCHFSAGGCHPTSQRTHSNPYNTGPYTNTHTHTWGTDPQYSTDREGNIYESSHTSHSYTHTVTYTCRHGHSVCELLTFSTYGTKDVAQDCGALEGTLLNQKIKYTTRVAVPLKTQMIIKKYITKVEHIGESCTNTDTFPEYNDTENEAAGVSTDRNTLMGYEGDDGVIPRGAYENEDPDFTPASSSGSETPNKMTNPVKVERGDEVTYTIKIINNSRFPTTVKVKDVLPDEGTDCECTSMPSEIRNSSAITVDAHSENVYEVKVRPIVNEGDYVNFVRFTTTNVTSEHMKYQTWGELSTFGAHTDGNLVNVFNLDADGAHQDIVDAVEWDHDKYRIKKYYVSVEKYIYEVEHESYSTGRDIADDDNLDTTFEESNKRSLNPATGGTLGLDTAESEKRAKPVYIEYGDRVTYKIKIYNTCQPYVDNEDSPYYKPDLVYVNIKDTLPTNYELDPDSWTIEIDGDNANAETRAKAEKTDTEFKCKNIRVPANGITTITVTLIATDNIHLTEDINTAEIDGDVRNINQGPDYNGLDSDSALDKYDVCFNVPKEEGKTDHIRSMDVWKINDYDATIDKYISHYDPSETTGADGNENNGFTQEETNDLDLKTLEGLDIKVLEDLDAFTKKEQRYPYTEDEKYDHPLMAEKNEELVFSIRVSNDSDRDGKFNDGPYSLESGKKPQTQVRPTRLTDYLQKGLTYLDVQAIQYELNDDNSLGDVIERYEYSNSVTIPVTHTTGSDVTKDGVECTTHYFDIDDKTILNPGECIVYFVRVRVDESNMYLYRLMNKAELTTLTNINHIKTGDEPHDRVVYERTEPTKVNDLSTQQESKDYVKMKDLVIAGKVWVDKSKNGYNEIIDEEQKEDVLVRLVYVDPEDKEHVIRTTRTDAQGKYSFAFDEDGNPYDGDYKVEGETGNLVSYESRQRIPKADPKNTTYKDINSSSNDQVPDGNVTDAKDKDANLNYENATPARYYVEFVYDGATYKATDIYSYYDHLKGTDDAEGSKWVTEKNNTNGYGDYINDSNSYEFKDEREAFNRQYETIGYDIAYSVDKDRTNSTTDDVTMMAFDKVGHTSVLLEETDLLNPIETWTENDRHRVMTARSFVKDTNRNRADDFDNTSLLWLFPLKSVTDQETQTEYLKYINLGLEEREDVDISIQKDVYQVKLTVNGEEVIYNYDKEPSDTLYKQTQDYIGIIRDSDYKYRYNQYVNEAVREYNTYKTEANMEVTYKIAITNNKIEDDEPGREKYNDIPIEVTIDEIADYYDKNFITYTDGAEAADIACGYDTIKDGSDGGASSYTEPYNFETGANKTTANCISMKRKENGDFKTDRKVKIAEAWYNGLEDREKGVYSEQLELHNKSIYNDKRDFESDGYQTLYIRGDALSDVRIKEGETHFVYVKYVVDKYEDTRNLKIADDKSDSLGLEGISEINAYSTWYGKVQTKESDVEYWNPDAADNEKIIKKSAKYTDDEAKHSEYKNLHPEYEAGYPAGLIDKDSNASNIGNPDGLSKITSIPTGNTLTEIIPEDDARKLEESKLNKGSEKASDTKIISADVVDEYEDDTFKVGIEDWLQIDGKLIKLKEGKKAEKGEEIVMPDNVTREISGVVWDDARTDSVTDSETNAVQYSGDGIIDREEKNDVAKTNENIRSLHCDLYKANSSDSYDSVLMDKENNGIPKTKLDDGTEIPGNVASEEEQFYEKQDFVVRDARVQLVEIVKVPSTTGEVDEDGNPVIRYYEEIGDEIKEYYEDHASEYWGDSLANDLLESTVYNVRTDAKGQYTLKGFMPGYYIVRFGYGDTTSSEMMTFNGQDYKSSKYMTTLDNVEDAASRDAAKTIDNVTFKSQSDTAYDPYTQKTELSEEMERKYDDILTALQRKNLNDARDDEISRLDSIAYSEIMTNAKAETLKGISSTTQYKEKDENGKFIESSGVASTKISNEDFEETKENMNKALAQNVQMNAETITFYVKPERVETSATGQATSWYEESTWSSEVEISETSQTINILDYIRGNYANCTNVEIYEFEDEGLIDHGTTGKRYANTYDYQISNIDFGITYRPESQVTLDKEIEEIKITTSDQKDILKVAFADRIDETTHAVKIDQETGRIQRRVDEENSIGLDKVQYLFNDDEHTDQGFFYINIDDEILQGSTISIEYQIRAENISEIDRISTNLDVLRYRENLTESEQSDIDGKGYLKISNPIGLESSEIAGIMTFDKLPIVFSEEVIANVKKVNADDPSIYLGSRTAERYLHDKTFSTDTNYTSDGEYRIIEKTLTEDGRDNYYGTYMGKAYYSNIVGDTDTLVDLKVSKILDYIDNDMEPSEKNTGKDHTWDRTTSDSMMTGDGYNGRYLKHSVFTKDAERYRLIDKDGIAYDTEKKSNLVVYRDDRRADDGKDLQNLKGLNETEAKAYDDKNSSMYNVSISRYMEPRYHVDYTANYNVNVETSNQYAGIVYLTADREVGAETDMDNLNFDNIAEIIEFTTPSGRRTNFKTTIGNAEIADKKGVYKVSLEEPDASATELVTLTPPTGLDRLHRAITTVVETTTKIAIPMAVIVIIALIGVGTVTFGIAKYKSRRIK